MYTQEKNHTPFGAHYAHGKWRTFFGLTISNDFSHNKITKRQQRHNDINGVYNV